MTRSPDPLDVVLGLGGIGLRAGRGAARTMLVPARVALRAPLVGGPLRAVADRLEVEGRRTRRSGRRELDAGLERALGSAELSDAVDRALAGPLTDAIARSLARHGVVDRMAAEFVATTDVDRSIAAALEHPMTRQAVETVLASPAFERILVEVLDSRVLLEVTDRILRSEEMQLTIERIAASPELRRAMAEQSAGLAQQTMEGVRRRSEALDDAAERTVRGWLRRPRPRTS
jgi:hypothetical protein